MITGSTWSPIKENDSGNFLQMNCCSFVSRDGTYGISYRCTSISEWGGIFISSDNCRTWHRKLSLDRESVVSSCTSGNKMYVMY